MAPYDESYCLICGWDGIKELRHYHISKIRDIKIMDEQSQPLPVNFHLDEQLDIENANEFECFINMQYEANIEKYCLHQNRKGEFL